MPAAAIIRGSIDVATASWDKVNPTELTCSGTLRIKSGNSGTITARWADDTTNTAVLEAGSVFPLVNVDLSKLELQASAADQGYSFIGDTYRSFP